MGERYNRYGRRLLLRVDDVTVCSVPPQWTDLIAPDPEIVIGEYRALFRVVDLLELERHEPARGERLVPGHGKIRNVLTKVETRFRVWL